MNPQDLQVASYRGVEFIVNATSVAGGRKSVVKPFVDSDLQVVEDLGLKPREFSVRGTIAARSDNSGRTILSYQQARDNLLQALELGGPGTLVHPFLGRLESISVLSFNMTEDMSKLGDSPIEITFAPSNSTGQPVAQENVLAAVTEGVGDTEQSMVADIADDFGVTPSFNGNFGDSKTQVESIGDAFLTASEVAAGSSDKVDAFNNEVVGYVADAASLVGNPDTLSTRTATLFSVMNGLYPTADATFGAFVNLFEFGDVDFNILPTTAGRVERQKNREILRSTVQGLSLAYAYESAAQLEFQTTDNIDVVAEILEAQYQKVVTAGEVSSDSEEELTQLRITTTAFFDDQRVTKPQVIDVETRLTSTRLLAYAYYGSSDLGVPIAELNELQDLTFVEGDVRILSA